MTPPTAPQIPGFQGVYISTDHPDDDARARWTSAVDRRPRLTARCGGTADVTASVRWAHESDLEIDVPHDPDSVFHVNQNIAPTKGR